QAKTTQSQVLYPLIDKILEVYGKDVRIRIGNAPLQGASWSRIITDIGLKVLQEYYNTRYQGLITLCDLRMNVQEQNIIGWSKLNRYEVNSPDIVRFNLAEKSLLEEQQQDIHYRVLDYPKDRIEACHSLNKHIYLLHKKILESDLIISVPKLKTHKKVGITTGLKGCVGAVALKDCLTHYRKGSPKNGGDEYPSSTLFNKSVSAYHDFVYSIPPSFWANIFRFSYRLFWKTHYFRGGILGGSWGGNDTAWRMALDLARIVAYGREDGSLSDKVEREHFVLTDGIIAGEGEGPLKPDPVHLGYLSWSEDIVASDFVNSMAMGIPLKKINIVNRAFSLDTLPLTTSQPEIIQIWLNHKNVSLGEFQQQFPDSFKLPKGW
ncbi:MAG: DUF362 domain-containing protein, partial [Deltaproteobacteria bacterium]|nr:DUF362 domain-containing protein [Deltaproteobacteria bacterium]